MLSTENPPPDLPCPCEISQLKNGTSDIGTDERASDKNQHQLEVDLLKSGLDDNNPPKFSIRDYVFNTRGKHMENNWPFSQENLQLCLKYGVTDVLPPFRSLDSVRNPATVKPAAENLRYPDLKLSELSDHCVDQKLAADIENINSSRYEEGKEFPSTTRSQSCSDLSLVPPTESLYTEPEAEYLQGSLTEKPELSVRIPNKVESDTQNPIMKCRLILKLNNTAERKSNEDSVTSETMASKVCPVCKAFSSSSNTTLNAHIDQCLSGESTIKWTENSKVIKHRIKPRKTKLMVDIYETAIHCTLEDLDRRNGTNWASNLGFPAQGLEVCAEEKNLTCSSVNVGNFNEKASVSKGSKLRSLSNLNDLRSYSIASYECGPSKLVEIDKGIKFPSSKKKYLVQRHKLLEHPCYGQRSFPPNTDHLLKCPPCEQKNCYPRPDHSPKPEVNEGRQKQFLREGYKEGDLTQPLTAFDQMKPDDLGMIKRWVGSKRTGLKKKINLQHENQNPDKIMKCLRESSCPSNSLVSSYENPVLPTESHKRKENLLCNSHDGCMEQPYRSKRPAFSLLKSQDCRVKKNNLISSNLNVKQSRKDSPSVHQLHVDPTNGTQNRDCSQSNKKMRINTSPDINHDKSFISSRMPQHHAFSSEGKEFVSMRKTSLDHAISSGSKKFSSLRKKLLFVRHASVPGLKKNLGKKHLDFKNRKLNYTSGSDEEAVVSQSAIYRQDNLLGKMGESAAQMKKDSGKPSSNGTRVLKIRKKRRGFTNTGKRDVSLKGSETSTESDSDGVGKNVHSFTCGNVPVDMSNVLEEVGLQDEYVSEPTYKLTDGEAFIAFSNSSNSTFHGLADPSNVECVSQHYSKALEGHSAAELVLGGEQEIFCADNVGKDLVTTTNSHVVAEMGADKTKRNYFVDVDPISIPGPPGSFLPSPGRMSSEDLQGNSSLTTFRIQSSEDEHEMVNMDSSDSPISAISAVSNPVAARSDSESVVNFLQSHAQHETLCGMSEDRIDPVTESPCPFEQTGNAERELILNESRSNLMLTEVSTRELKNVQPCCCSRKDGALQSGSSIYQGSKLLRQQAMSSLSVVAQESRTADDPKYNIHSSKLGSETFPGKEPTPEPEKNTANSPMGYAPALVSHNSEAKFQAYVDCKSLSPSTSNPILRLMGKNLMVVNKDENLSPQTRPAHSSMVIEHPGLRLCDDNGLSTSNNQNKTHYSGHSFSRGPSIFANMQTDMPAQHFDSNASDEFEVPANFRPPQVFTHPSTVMLSSKSFGGNCSSSLNCYEYASGYNLIPDQLGPSIRLETQRTYNIEQVQTHVRQHKTTEFSGSKHKEIIAIDDSPESEASIAVIATQCKVNMETEGYSVRVAASMAPQYDPRHANPLYGYQTRGYPLCTGFPMVQNGNIQVPPSKGINANLGKWNCISEGSSVLHPNSLNVSLPSRAHLMRSSLYFSPGFS